MKKMNGTFVAIFALALALSACGGGGGGGSTPASPGPTPTLSFLQSIASTNTTSRGTEYFPGQANIWTLDWDFSVFNDQFAYSQWLIVGGPTGTEFPSDQLYTELTFSTPIMGELDGVKAVAISDGISMNLPPLAGSYSAFLNATVDSRLQRTLSLPAGPISIRWHDKVNLSGSFLLGFEPTYKVVVRRLDGSVLKTLYNYDYYTSPTTEQSHSVGLSQLEFPSPTTVVLSFEESSSTSWFDEAHVIIDTVSVKDGSNVEYVTTNGGFESGDLTGWTVSTPTELQNATSGSRSIEGLTVKRSFYTVPNKLWARWVDVFENKTVTQITTTITYETDLWSSGAGLIYSTPGTTNQALTSWDTSALTNDIGLVFGNAAPVIFSSSTGTVPGSEYITVSYSITVPAGGRAAIVNFALMSGTDTGLDPVTGVPVLDFTLKATDIDAEALNIVSNFWSVSDDQYRKGMTQQQLDAIVNFPH